MLFELVQSPLTPQDVPPLSKRAALFKLCRRRSISFRAFEPNVEILPRYLQNPLSYYCLRIQIFHFNELWVLIGLSYD